MTSLSGTLTKGGGSCCHVVSYVSQHQAGMLEISESKHSLLLPQSDTGFHQRFSLLLSKTRSSLPIALEDAKNSSNHSCSTRTSSLAYIVACCTAQNSAKGICHIACTILASSSCRKSSASHLLLHGNLASGNEMCLGICPQT